MLDLPARAPKGQRRSFDQLWLTKLQQDDSSVLRLATQIQPPALTHAVIQFNEGQYWECHETLEEIWMTEEYPLRLFYHGLIKAAVGLLHLKRHNLRGARIKLTEAEATLAPFVPIIMGIDVGSLLNDIQQHLELVRGDLPLNRDEIDRLPLTQIRDPI